MIQLSNGHKLEFLAASGSLAFDGLGWPWEQPARWLKFWDPSVFTVVLKTLTFDPRLGNQRWYNPHKVVKWLDGQGHVNSIGLTNMGFMKWCELVAPRLRPDMKFIVSITGTPTELRLMAGRLNSFDIVAVEINASCPNSPDHSALLSNVQLVEESVKVVAEVCRHPIILKLSYQQQYLEIICSLAHTLAAVSINSVPWGIVYPGKPSPLPKKFGHGGVSGKVAQQYTWAMIDRLVRDKKVPVIGASVWDYPDLEILKAKGVGAVAFGSVFIKHRRHVFCPCLPDQYVTRWRREHGEF